MKAPNRYLVSRRMPIDEKNLRYRVLDTLTGKVAASCNNSAAAKDFAKGLELLRDTRPRPVISSSKNDLIDDSGEW